MNLNEFSQRIRVVAKDVNENVNRLVRRVALVVDRQIVLATPVDTGRARANWLVALGAPPSGEVPAPGGGEAASVALAAANAVVGRREPGQDIWIGNNVPYIGRLNDGYSKQAPANFVETAMLAGAKMVANARIID